MRNEAAPAARARIARLRWFDRLTIAPSKSRGERRSARERWAAFGAEGASASLAAALAKARPASIEE